ncbi:MAG TPA: helix-turn-helix transcriptional regulator [Actinomycetes bacterium]|nr:helix-turn-helix transcriptional regulator [Actinomycetes bacterium]HEX5877418.1 helix-turn-helix transcriptional regulator [Actinomycetota bacterium]
MTTRTPTGRRRRLGAELRRLREETGLTIDQVAEVLECSQSKVSRIETGQVSATPRDVRDMLALYRVSDAQREAMVQIAREARQPGWWQKFVDVPDGVPAYVGLETAATSIDIYMSVIVPALLQTADYARAVIGAVRPDLPGAEIDRRVELRLRRQALLDQDSPPALRVLLDDTVLRRPVGGEKVMAAQRRRLLEDAARPAVTLQVLPVEAGAHAGMDGPFTIFGFPAPAERDVVALDSAADALYLEGAEDVARYRRVFGLLLPAALTPEASAGRIAAAGVAAEAV